MNYSEQIQDNSTDFLPIGTLLKKGTYRVEAVIASGGFGKTYVVVNNTSSLKYAMKEFFHADINDRASDGKKVKTVSSKKPAYNNMKNSFLKEAQKIARLNHMHVIRVYDYFEENSTAYYVMDFIEGCTLLQKLDSANSRLPHNEVRNYLCQLLDALEYIHGHGILHLDLKPSNIMLGNDGNITLIDFGASKGFNADGSLSSDSKFVYTPGFAPIELRENNKNKIGTWTDFYSLGATIYKLVTNKKVPEFSDIDDYFKGITTIYPFDFNGVEHDIRLIIQLCMNPNRAERPKSVKEIRKIIASSGQQKKGNWKKVLIILLILVCAILSAILAIRVLKLPKNNSDIVRADSISQDTTLKTGTIDEPFKILQPEENQLEEKTEESEWKNGRVVDDNSIEYLYDQPTND